jgi:glycosyltransferase involved in cell wall biosynthesis
MKSRHSITAIVPVYNEEAAVADAIAAIERFLDDQFEDFEIVIVESGSTDGSGAVCDDMAARSSRIYVHHEGARNGFGSAVRAGFERSGKEWVWPLVVDMPFPLESMCVALPLMDTHDAVLSYRSTDPRGSYRRFQSAVFNLLSRSLLGVRVRHVNSAFKVVRTSVIRSLALKQRGWLLDAELIAGLERRGHAYAEIAVELSPRVVGRSTIGPAAVWRSILDLLALARDVRRQ